MLKSASLYESQINIKIAESAGDLKYLYSNGSYVSSYKAAENNWNVHEFVSVDKDDNIIGLIAYDIDRSSYNVSGMTIMNFSDNKILFGLDLKTVIFDIFLKYNFKKLAFCVYVGNPIEKSYDRMVEKCNGRIVGIKKEETRLMDGNLYDMKMYEIFRKDFVLMEGSY